MSRFSKALVLSCRLLKTAFFTIIACALAACGSSDETTMKDSIANVKVITLVSYEPNQVRELVGRVEQTGIVPLAFKVSGQLVKVTVRDGEMVKKGDLMAEIDRKPYILAVNKARNRFNKLSNDLIKSYKLRDKHILPQATYEKLEMELEVARSRLSSAEDDLHNTQLLAPFDGKVVFNQPIELLQTVQAGEPIFSLENDKQLNIIVDIPKYMINSIKLDRDIKAIAWLPDQRDVELSLQYKEHLSQDTGRAYLVFTTTSPEDITLLTNMLVQVRLLGGVNYNTDAILWSLPVATLAIDSKGQYFIWRLDEKTRTAQRVNVKITEIHKKHVIVHSQSLLEGQRIVNIEQQFIREGQKLNIVNTL